MAENKIPAAKIFCVGFQKTGTTSLRDALRQLGYSITSVYGRDLPIEELRKQIVPLGLEIAKDHDVMADMPWPLIYKEFDKAYPGTKFIHTVRDTDSWYRSIVGHFGERPDIIQQLVYGDDAATPIGNEARYKEVYEAHNAEVLDYFKDRPDDFIVMSLQDGDGWAKLGAFIGREDVPDGPFVRSNTAADKYTLKRRIRNKVRRVKRLFS